MPMASLRDISTKIGAVKKTKQITKAMNMVASAKLRGAQQRIERFRPYAEKFYDMLQELSAKADSSAHPLLEVREEIKTVGVVVMTSDRGLCGSFNANMIREGNKVVKAKLAEGKRVVVYTVGKKGRDALRKQGYEMGTAYPDRMNNFDFTLANELGVEIIESYLSKQLDEVILVYGNFISMARQVPEVQPLLPIAPKTSASEDGKKGVAQEYIYEPDVVGLLAELLPRFLKVQVYKGLLSTSASEHAARMAAMDNATKACDDMVGALTLVFNKTRQAAITTELMDIVGGAEALKG
ncbi:F0F1 ATP synthase subunit gamma [Megalodesulfovibrio paquesii]